MWRALLCFSSLASKVLRHILICLQSKPLMQHGSSKEVVLLSVAVSDQGRDWAPPPCLREVAGADRAQEPRGEQRWGESFGLFTESGNLRDRVPELVHHQPTSSSKLSLSLSHFKLSTLLEAVTCQNLMAITSKSLGESLQKNQNCLFADTQMSKAHNNILSRQPVPWRRTSNSHCPLSRRSSRMSGINFAWS